MGIKFLRYCPTILWLAAILFASFMPSQHIKTSWLLFPQEDKVIHICMYLGLAALFLINSRHFFVVTLRRTLLTIGVICILSGAIELLQPVLSNRTCDLDDFFANSLGAIIGGFIGKKIANHFCNSSL
ncbi:MAG: VanZ family protein [Bacteroidales bacterium]|nr:VanZ family protein [Bacteroidales bacterium]